MIEDNGRNTSDLQTPIWFKSAADLELLEQLVPGTINRVLMLTEQQQKHRHEWENNSLSLYADERKRSTFYAFSFAIVALFCALGLGYLDEPTAASIIGGGTIATVVTAFVMSNRDKSRIHDELLPHRLPTPGFRSPRAPRHAEYRDEP